jgi:hypothetical protein
VTAPKPWRRRVSRSGGVPLDFVTDAPQLAAGSFTPFGTESLCLGGLEGVFPGGSLTKGCGPWGVYGHPAEMFVTCFQVVICNLPQWRDLKTCGGSPQKRRIDIRLSKNERSQTSFVRHYRTGHPRTRLFALVNGRAPDFNNLARLPWRLTRMWKSC